MLVDASGDLVEILLVEDSPTDVMMTREALEYYKVLNPLRVVEDGVEAMAFLRRDGQYASVRRPGLILLDLNLPRKSGREVLQELKGDPALMTIPVVILTTSKSEEDVVRSYGFHANCYITKPVDFTKFSDVVRTINDYWFGVVTLPPSER
ncbi:two-component system response regulator [Burkholderia ubonensis]|uniref:Two-component system response regulator n=1 Tax=Burkholderia ubonensis TaxID=101571 RepID=A0A119FLD9_9BURK|nr:response regulator [Burkholderia ubonensis]KVG69432.1 two-component system response regulator [Burkholderia ubonensis]KVH78799.1 two-component system response regulator [Burkholderia ubonensis]KVN88840.1 two-component system response regulator [Burkholderia ubonensis]KVO82807.1 two-component system response regulator [Burkholderia ubonensis]KVU04992.1 two-component system response regulator [Burkholderia ubonensis]